MEFLQPTSFQDAAAIAAGQARGTARFLAGGTDVLVQMRSEMVMPDTLIDLKHIPGVNDITRDGDGGWTLGVAVTGAALSAHEGLCNDWPGVVEAMRLVGSVQVQGRATPVGNLMNASPAADSVPAMIAAGAEVTITAADGATRRVAVAEVPVGPGRTSLASGEVISALHLPPRGDHAADAYQRFTPRTEMDIAVVGCAVSLRLEGAIVRGARVALGAVAPTARLVPEAGAAIIGSTLDEAALAALAEAATAACDPINDKRGTIAQRRRVAGVLAGRVAKQAYVRAGGMQ